MIWPQNKVPNFWLPIQSQKDQNSYYSTYFTDIRHQEGSFLHFVVTDINQNIPKILQAGWAEFFLGIISVTCLSGAENGPLVIVILSIFPPFSLRPFLCLSFPFWITHPPNPAKFIKKILEMSIFSMSELQYMQCEKEFQFWAFRDREDVLKVPVRHARRPDG